MGIQHKFQADEGLRALEMLLLGDKLNRSSVASLIKRSDATRKPPVPAAGSCTISPGCGLSTRTTQSIKGRGVKYCPAPDFFSPAFFWRSPLVEIAQPLASSREPIQLVNLGH